MPDKKDVMPRNLSKVIDLVQEAGIDVSGWSSGKGGAGGAKTNPNFCYEWVFIKPGSSVVLNIWHHDIDEAGGVLRQRLNPRNHAQRLSKVPHMGGVAARAHRMDDILRTAFLERLPARVIILAGRATEQDHIDGKKLKVKGRMLDPVPWSVTSYDPISGDCVLTRGVPPEPYVDQFSMDPGEHAVGAAEKRGVTSQVFVRSEEVRRQVRLRAEGRCEWCQKVGFKTATGEIYLETHHVISLSEGGPDVASNVVALCPNHHREAHHGKERDEMRLLFLSRINNPH